MACGSRLILGFCVLAIFVVSNEANRDEGYRRCNKYCLEEIQANHYDCYLYCFFKCAPSMGGTGCFKSMEQAGQSLNIPDQFWVEEPASEPISFEQWTSQMNSNFKSTSDSNANSDSNSGVGLN
ncbi:hypothetical protein Patl1_21468 [Pistacia atlantica]|uniref:Uncharacterized protein n=1 Tax=Pistacia atlantica TaxID=434234 RepID=A0ACC1BK44_9ROSI|nr:hypothetical protein Patl1_21468 [Pistacia atlantica]